MRLREIGIGAVALVVLAALFVLGRASVGAPVKWSSGEGHVSTEPSHVPVDGETYTTKLGRIWSEVIDLNQGMLDKVRGAEQGHLQELAAMARTNREALQRLYGRIEGLTCPRELADNRENLLSGIRSNLDYLDHLSLIAESGGGAQDFADLASSGDSATRYYGKAKLTGWRNFPDEVFSVKGKIERLIRQTRQSRSPEGNSAKGDDPQRQVSRVEDPIESAYLTEMRSLVTAYEATRGQFSQDIQYGISGGYSTAQAYRTRLGILARLNRLEPAPPRFATVHATFESVVNEGLEALKSFYDTQDRFTLTQASAHISVRLGAVKRSLGMQ